MPMAFASKMKKSLVVLGLRLLADKVVELEIVPAVSHVTLQKMLKKR